MEDCGTILASVNMNDPKSGTSGQEPLPGVEVSIYNQSDPCFASYVPPNKASNIKKVLENCAPHRTCITNSSGECTISGLYVPHVYKGIVNSTAYPGRNPNHDINITACYPVDANFSFLKEPKGKGKAEADEGIPGIFIAFLLTFFVAVVFAMAQFRMRR
jgi:hypothetical protein